MGNMRKGRHRRDVWSKVFLTCIAICQRAVVVESACDTDTGHNLIRYNNSSTPSLESPLERHEELASRSEPFLSMVGKIFEPWSEESENDSSDKEHKHAQEVDTKASSKSEKYTTSLDTSSGLSEEQIRRLQSACISDFQTLASTLSSSLPNSKITICAGSYIIVQETLTLQADHVTISCTTKENLNDAGNRCTLDGQHRGGRILTVNGEGATIQDITFQNGNFNEGSGGALLVAGDGQHIIERCGFVTNHANDGGAIFHQKGSLILRHNTFLENTCNFRGAAVSIASHTEGIITGVSLNDNQGIGNDSFSDGCRDIYFEASYTCSPLTVPDTSNAVDKIQIPDTAQLEGNGITPQAGASPPIAPPAGNMGHGIAQTAQNGAQTWSSPGQPKKFTKQDNQHQIATMTGQSAEDPNASLARSYVGGGYSGKSPNGYGQNSADKYGNTKYYGATAHNAYYGATYAPRQTYYSGSINGGSNTGGNYNTNTGANFYTNTGGNFNTNTGANYYTNSGGNYNTNTGANYYTNTGGNYNTNTGGNYNTNTGGNYYTNNVGNYNTNTGNYYTNTGNAGANQQYYGNGNTGGNAYGYGYSGQNGYSSGYQGGGSNQHPNACVKTFYGLLDRLQFAGSGGSVQLCPNSVIFMQHTLSITSSNVVVQCLGNGVTCTLVGPKARGSKWGGVQGGGRIFNINGRDVTLRGISFENAYNPNGDVSVFPARTLSYFHRALRNPHTIKLPFVFVLFAGRRTFHHRCQC
jgi:hypothetical protein